MRVQEYFVSWQYGKLDDHGTLSGLTRCIISVPSFTSFKAVMDGERPVYNVMGEGIAKKSPKDQFNREKARRVSLNAALLSTFPGREQKEIRAEFWEAYRQMGIKPRWKKNEKKTSSVENNRRNKKKKKS